MTRQNRWLTFLGLFGGTGGLITCVMQVPATIQATPEAATNLQTAGLWLKGKIEPMLTASVIGGTAMVIGFGGAALLLAQPYLTRRFPRLAAWLPQPDAAPVSSLRPAAPTLADEADSRALPLSPAAAEDYERRLRELEARQDAIDAQTMSLVGERDRRAWRAYVQQRSARLGPVSS
jgi:hypothetical protein